MGGKRPADFSGEECWQGVCFHGTAGCPSQGVLLTTLRCIQLSILRFETRDWQGVEILERLGDADFIYLPSESG